MSLRRCRVASPARLPLSDDFHDEHVYDLHHGIDDEHIYDLHHGADDEHVYDLPDGIDHDHYLV